MTPRPLEPTLSLDHAASGLWDALVVGAGPAGALAACELARQGVSVLLVDHAAFPRRKVCGCCVNAAALATLEAVGLGDLPARLGAQPLRQLDWFAGRWRASIPLPAGVAISREALDAALIHHAIDAGAQFLPHTHARLDGLNAQSRCVELREDRQDVTVRARVVLAADGLSGTCVARKQGFKSVVRRHSRIGVSTVALDAPSFYDSGIIFMIASRGGYVGLVRLEDGTLNIAAAFDPVMLRRSGGPAPAVATLLETADLPCIDALDRLPWRGTPALTSSRARLADERLFVIGDAASYIEPFTGEGIAWALASGVAVVPFVLEARQRWTPALALQWTRMHRRLIGRRQRTCWLMSAVLRRMALTRTVVAVLSRVPQLAAPVIQTVNAPFQLTSAIGYREA